MQDVKEVLTNDSQTSPAPTIPLRHFAGVTHMRHNSDGRQPTLSAWLYRYNTTNGYQFSFKPPDIVEVEKPDDSWTYERWFRVRNSEQVKAKQRSTSLASNQWAALDTLAKITDSRAMRGPRTGQPSWRVLLRRLADESEFTIDADGKVTITLESGG